MFRVSMSEMVLKTKVEAVLRLIRKKRDLKGDVVFL